MGFVLQLFCRNHQRQPKRKVQVMEPFLRWAGGKRWLVPQLQQMITPSSFKSYHEPFLGSAAMFLGLDCNWQSAALSDSNPDLIDTFRTVRDSPREVHEVMLTFSNEASTYYAVRASIPPTKVEKAARFIYLNHTSFNGIYRVNARGEYNVPYGNRRWVKFPTADDLESAAARFVEADIDILDFETSLERVEDGAFVFIDPPYSSQLSKSTFVRYTSTVFDFEDQKRLAQLVRKLDRRGIAFALTNADEESIAELYDGIGKHLVIHRRSTVGGQASASRSMRERLITNLTSGDVVEDASRGSLGKVYA